MITRAELEEQIRFASRTIDLLHAAAVERGEFEVHVVADEPPYLVTEYRREPVTFEQLEQLGIDFERG